MLEAEKEVESLSKENVSLKNKLAAKEVELNDHIIKIRVSFLLYCVTFFYVLSNF